MTGSKLTLISDKEKLTMIDAKLTLDQLTMSNNGASRLNATIGAKSFVKDIDYVAFRFPMKARNKANYCKITLNDLDLYNVEFGYIRAGKYTIRSEDENLYFDMLKKHFETETGLYLSI